MASTVGRPFLRVVKDINYPHFTCEVHTLNIALGETVPIMGSLSSVDPKKRTLTVNWT